MDAPSDLDAYRPNVGVALFNSTGQVFLGRRAGARGSYCWQMPQGGIDPGEAPFDAALRELREETGVPAALTRLLGTIEDWLTYDFPPEALERNQRDGKPWVGQRQRWFAFRFLGSDSDVDLAADDEIEFDAWRWERLSRAPEMVIPWKRQVYLQVVRAFTPFASSEGPDDQA